MRTRDEIGRVAVVTGGANGIGLAIARAFLAHGDAVVVADLDEAGLRRLAGASASDAVRTVAADVGTPDGAERTIAAAVEAFGRVDVLCNNAGVRPVIPFLELEPEEFAEAFRVNVGGIFLCSRAAIPHMLRQGGGSIVNIGSISGVHGYAGGSAYAASKAAAIQLSRVMALELAPRGIRVNCICPGSIETQDPPGAASAGASAIPVGRAGRPAEVADLVLFLASDAAAFMAGSVVTLDGGITAGRVRRG
jgi:NAD(P)-dependent dehydrogenase (short-subunit alcohol dehydrogenase family)